MTGAELVKSLKESGTGKDKLNVARKILKGDPTVSAEQLAKSLKASGVSNATLKKCEDLINFGAVQPEVEQQEIDIEDEILLEAATAPRK